MERIVNSTLGRYFSVFIKNYSKNALNLNVMKGEGELKNLEINEDVIQEILPIAFLEVKRAYVNKLSIKLPSLTRLSNDPIVIVIDRVQIEIEEPIKGRPLRTPLMNFLNAMSAGKTKTDKTAKKAAAYGYVDKIIDGIRVEINSISIIISTLGSTPSRSIGPWTPPILSIQIADVALYTTNGRWRIVDLKDALPKFTGKGEGFVYKYGKCGSLSVSLIPQYVDPSDPNSGVATLLIDQLPLSIKRA
eukprot:GEZU01015015.1.p1 GENE.GEZU01015015.1~~GEZU01015015.1.p1  ORF type:complete len:247 (-),score=47.44 GEZU01015015.1:12-752(-)